MKISDLFKQSKGVIIGENHSAVSPKKFIIQNAPWLKSQGFEVMFLEHLTEEEHQPLINQYYTEGVMPEALKRYLLEISKGHSGIDSCTFYLDLVVALKSAEIAIICLEKSMQEYRDPSKESGRGRIEYFNQIASDAINQYVENNPEKNKWLAFVGTTHVEDHVLHEDVRIAGIANRIAGEGICSFSIISDAGKSDFSLNKEEFVLMLPDDKRLRIYSDLQYYNSLPEPDPSKSLMGSIDARVGSKKIFAPDSFLAKNLFLLNDEDNLEIDRIDQIFVHENPESFLQAVIEANIKMQAAEAAETKLSENSGSSFSGEDPFENSTSLATEEFRSLPGSGKFSLPAKQKEGARALGGGKSKREEESDASSMLPAAKSNQRETNFSQKNEVSENSGPSSEGGADPDSSPKALAASTASREGSAEITQGIPQ